MFLFASDVQIIANMFNNSAAKYKTKRSLERSGRSGWRATGSEPFPQEDRQYANCLWAAFCPMYRLWKYVSMKIALSNVGEMQRKIVVGKCARLYGKIHRK